MSFSYILGRNSLVDYVRLMIPDTINTTAQPCLFQDEEITSMNNVTSMVWQSAQRYSGYAGQATLPAAPVNILRTVAYCLNALASNQAMLSSVIALLDVKLDAKSAAAALRTQAQSWLDIDDNSMAFVIIEQVQTNWALRDRFTSQVQRHSFV